MATVFGTGDNRSKLKPHHFYIVRKASISRVIPVHGNERALYRPKSYHDSNPRHARATWYDTRRDGDLTTALGHQPLCMNSKEVDV